MPRDAPRSLAKRWTALALGAAALLAGALAWRLGPAREAARAALGSFRLHQRAALAAEGAGPPALAASQVGYGPAMGKRFSSPRPFASFRVIDARDGSVAFAGGAPLREAATESAGRAWIGDLTPLVTPGRYRVAADNGLASHPFDVGPGVFDAAVRAVQRAFYFQRAFTAVDAAHAEGPWTHPSDADKAPPGVRMGWHDAGDLSLYSASLNTALYWLLETWSDFAPAADDTNIPESGNGVPDLLDEARWGLEWLLSVQDASGGLRNTTCQDAYGPYGTNAPERVPRYRDGEVGTLATARAVGTLAYASAIWRGIDPAFSARCLEAARRGEAFLRARPGESSDGPTCPAYRADGDARIGRQARMYAAAGMLLATGEARFRDAFEEAYVELDYDPSFRNYNGFAAQLYLRAAAGDPARKQAIRERLREHAGQARADGERHPYEWAARLHWGSLGAGFTRTGSYNVKRCLEDPAAAADCEQALADVHYALGRNPLGFCYVSGLPGVTRGRAGAFHHWLAALRARPYAFPGMVAGGPNAAPEPDDVSRPAAWPFPFWGYLGDPAFPRDAGTLPEARYTDNDSWSTNEVSLDWQASALYSLAFAQWSARGRPPAQR